MSGAHSVALFPKRDSSHGARSEALQTWLPVTAHELGRLTCAPGASSASSRCLHPMPFICPLARIPYESSRYRIDDGA